MAVTETLHGFIETTQDALLVFEGCRRGLLPRTSRRLQEKERRMIQSGSIFVFDERESGIKRWTDGRMWSPSRILGNFLIYREVNKRLPGSSDSRRSSSSSASSASHSGDMRQRSFSVDQSSRTGSAMADRGRERQLVGSLSDVHAFRKDGLIKKTVSIVVNGVAQHLISYYHPRDVLHGELRNPTSMPHLAALEISSDLVRQNFRVALSVDGGYSGTDLPASALLNYPLSHPDPERQQQQQQQQQQHPFHNQLRSMSVGSLYGYGEPSTLPSSFYSNTDTVTAAGQKFPPTPLYSTPHQQPNTIGPSGSPFPSASTPLSASSVRRPLTSSSGSCHAIISSSSYSPNIQVLHYQHGVQTRDGDGIPGGVQPTYHSAAAAHPLHSNHHLVSSFTTTNPLSPFEDFHPSQPEQTSEHNNSHIGVTNNTTHPGTSLFGFTTNAHPVAVVAGIQHQHQQYEQAATTPSPQLLSKSFYSSTC